eukprot:15452084-Alexandrium_andersonii.AAC.1
MGAAEGAARRAEELTRSYVLAVSEHIGCEVISDNIASWAMRHAGFTYSRFAMRSAARRTPYEELKMVKFMSVVHEFGEAVQARRPGDGGH